MICTSERVEPFLWCEQNNHRLAHNINAFLYKDGVFMTNVINMVGNEKNIHPVQYEDMTLVQIEGTVFPHVLHAPMYSKHPHFNLKVPENGSTNV